MPKLTIQEKEIVLTQGRVSALVLPQRGALISHLQFDGKDILYFDHTTLDDPKGKIRGGIPLCWPVAGPGVLLPNALFPVPQHGICRRASFATKYQSSDRLELLLEADENTRSVFPFDFELGYVIELTPKGIYCRLTTQNTDSSAFPISSGWHPYFLCPQETKSDLKVTLSGFQSLDNLSDFDYGIASPGSGRVVFDIPSTGRIALEFSPMMRHLQFWTLAGSDFVCIEPFMNPPRTFGSAECNILLPGEKLTVEFSIIVLTL